MGTVDRALLAVSGFYEIFTETSRNFDNRYSTSDGEGTTLRVQVSGFRTERRERMKA
jgi:hypothetical protein